MKKHLIIKAFEELSLSELYAILRLRQEVFIVVQNCPYLDADNLDQVAIHFMLYDKNSLAAYSRVFSPNTSNDNYASIGRIISSNSVRGKGYGKRIVEDSIEYCTQHFKNAPIKISAQVYLLEFYNSFGFKERGEQYLEDGIPHLEMILHP